MSGLGRRLRVLSMGAAMLCVASGRSASAEPPQGAADAIVLRSGKVLEGRVVGRAKQGDVLMLTVETDFGRILVPATEVKDRGPGSGDCGDVPFAFRTVRVVDVAGRVLRRPRGAQEWTPLVDPAYRQPDAPLPELAPGDSVRTGADGVVALMPHRDVWIRLAPDSEIEILGPGEGASVDVRGGDLVARVSAPPRGCGVTFRTPSALLALREGGVVLRSLEGRDSVGVRDGAVQVEGGPRLEAGSGADLRPGEPARVRSLAEIERLRGDVALAIPPADDMVAVAGGRFPLGAPPHGGSAVAICVGADKYRVESNECEHVVEVAPFLLDRQKVSNADFACFASATGRTLPYYLRGVALTPELGRKPVHGVSWADARAFARWCGKDLPTVTQWAAAARGPRGSRFPWGDAFGADEQAFVDQWWGPTKVGGDYGPTRLPCVDQVTRDRTPTGILGLSSPPAEWCRELVEETRIVFAGAPRPAPGTEHAFRELLPTRIGYPSQTEPCVFEVGFRCARELR
ncbi:MAG: formylglycine-generating enzyme family protein [Polyangiaceae bacterium]|nr:formylglycine-generating enzyme family protein [Polyangiaceae bacterium]